MLQETRMVLFEKDGQNDVWFALSSIDYIIERRKSLHIGYIYIPDAYIKKEWLYNKDIKKVLEDNGFEIFDKFHQVDTRLGYIRHRNYYKKLL